METVFIADDEQNIREGLKRILDWEELGFTVCGEAASGEEALEGILKRNPSLVLMDIQMPRLQGTEIIRIAREQGYGGKFIIISGYSDFSYAQTAIRYGALYYLTKPIDEDELKEAVESIRESLIRERENINATLLIRKKARNTILAELITGTLSADESEVLPPEEIESLNLTADAWQVVIYEDFDSEVEPEYSFAELLKVSNRENQSFEHLNIDGNDVILLKGTYSLHKFERILDRYEQQEPQEGSPLASLFLAYGRPVQNLDEVYLSYEEALTLCSRRFFCTQGQHTLGYGELPFLGVKENEISGDKARMFGDLLTNSLQTFNRRKVAEALHDLEVFLYCAKDDIAAIKGFLTDIIFQVKEKIGFVYRADTIPFSPNSEIISRIDNSRYLYEIIRFISEQTDVIINTIAPPPRDTVLDDILYYIDHNYHTNIRLENIAPLFGYNSAYLGKIFTKATGESFNTYIDHLRIEHSKELLLENQLKVYEIAERVGYKNVDYFHKKFKKYVGVSPAEFRKSVKA